MGGIWDPSYQRQDFFAPSPMKVPKTEEPLSSEENYDESLWIIARGGPCLNGKIVQYSIPESKIVNSSVDYGY